VNAPDHHRIAELERDVIEEVCSWDPRELYPFVEFEDFRLVGEFPETTLQILFSIPRGRLAGRYGWRWPLWDPEEDADNLEDIPYWTTALAHLIEYLDVDLPHGVPTHEEADGRLWPPDEPD
jgi:hypothetical protein